LFGHGPEKAHEFPGKGHDHLVGVFPAGQELTRAFTQPYLGLPTEVLDRLRELFKPALQGAAALGGIPGGPGAVDQDTTRMAIASLGNRPLPPALTAGIFCGEQAKLCHQLSGLVEARQGPEFGDEGHRAGELDAPQRLPRLNHRRQAPGVPVFVKFLLQALQAFGMLMDRADVFLEDELWHGGGTDHFGEPPQMGWAPGSPACLANSVSEQEGCEPKRGGLEIADGICTRAGEVTDGLVFHLGNIDGCEVA
jgi:hypothetical protein